MHFVADFLLVNVLAGLSVAVDMWMAIVSALSMFDNKLAPFWNCLLYTSDAADE